MNNYLSHQNNHNNNNREAIIIAAAIVISFLLFTFYKLMEAILKYIDKLNELKIDPIKPSSFINNLENIMYEDKETKTLSIPALLIKEALKSKNGYIVAPKVLKQ